MDIDLMIKDFVINELANESYEGEIDIHHSLIQKGIIDSMAIMVLIRYIEQEFSITISGTDLTPQNFENISTIAELVSLKLNTHKV